MSRSRSSSSTDDLEPPRWLEVGRIDRPHGVRGEVLVSLTTNRLERLESGAQLEASRGVLRVEWARSHQHRFIVRFAEITDRDQAASWRGEVLRAEAIDEPGTLWVHELVGAELLDLDGALVGVVAALEANPASDLLVLDTGALVPLRFVRRDEQGRLVGDLPPGLLDL